MSLIVRGERGFLALASVLVCAGTAFSQEPPDDRLLRMSLEDLLSVRVVTASMRPELQVEAPSIISVVTRSEIEAYGDRTVGQALERFANVFTYGTYEWPHVGIAVRGDLSTQLDQHTLILLDGRPVRESFSGGFNHPIYQAFPVEMIERIEFVRGAGSVLHGTNAFSSVVNIITRESTETNLAVATQMGRYGNKRAVVRGGSKTENFSTHVVFQVDDIDGWNYRLIDNNGVDGQARNFKKSYSLAANTQVYGVRLNIFAASIRQFSFGPLLEWNQDRTEDNFTQKVFADLGYSWEIGGGWRFEPHLTYNQHYFEFDFPAAPSRKFAARIHDVLAEVTLLGAVNDDLNLILGSTVERQQLPGGQTNSPVPAYERKFFSFYTQLDYRLGRDTKVVGGLQANVPEDRDATLVPRLSLVHQFNDKLRARLIFDQAFSNPSPDQTNSDNPVIRGNPRLKPELISSFNARVDYGNGTLQVGVTAFYNKLFDLITKVPQAGGPSLFQNTGSVSFFGWEFEGRLVAGQVDIIAALSVQKDVHERNVGDAEVPSTGVRLGARYRTNRSNLGLQARFQSSTPTIDEVRFVNDDPGSAFLVDVNWGYEVGRLFGVENLKASVKFENILNQKVFFTEINQQVVNSVPVNPGFRYFVGLSIDF